MSYQNIYSMILTLNKEFHNYEILGDSTHISHYSEYTPLILLCKNMREFLYFQKVPKSLLKEIKRKNEIKRLSEELLIAKEKLLEFSGETYTSQNHSNDLLTRQSLKRGGLSKYPSYRRKVKSGGAKGKRKKMQKRKAKELKKQQLIEEQ